MKRLVSTLLLCRGVALYLACIAAFATLGGCGAGDGGMSVEQVGYFKGDPGPRYITFNLEDAELVDRQSIPDSLVQLIREHGAKQMNTPGQLTASFYYLGGSAPDITMLNAQQANDAAHAAAPLVAVWIMPNGQVNVIENPE